MPRIRWTVGVFLASTLGVNAQSFSANGARGASDPLVQIYRIPGVVASGTNSQGAATTVRCTSFSSVFETVRAVVVDQLGANVRAQSASVTPKGSVTFSTNIINSTPGGNLGSPAIVVGAIKISSTSPQVHCTAMIVDAAATIPTGVALHVVRTAPLQGTAE